MTGRVMTLDGARVRAEDGTSVQMLRRLSRVVEGHDGETGAHIERVGEHAAAIARCLGHSDHDVELIRAAAPLHDIGKVGVPTALLQKRGPLEPEERAAVERHTVLGREILAGSGNAVLDLAAAIAWTHHERWDGRGYPRGLAERDIPLPGRIVALADVFDAITSDRPYRAARSVDEAISIILAQRCAAFDPAVVDAFLGGAA